MGTLDITYGYKGKNSWLIKQRESGPRAIPYLESAFTGPNYAPAGHLLMQVRSVLSNSAWSNYLDGGNHSATNRLARKARAQAKAIGIGMSNWIAVPQSAGVDWQISAFDGGALANVYAHVFSPWQIAKSVLHDTKGVTPTKQVRGNGTIVYSISAEFGDFEFFVQDEIITVVKFHQGNEQGTVRTTSLGRDTPMPTIPNSKRKSFTRLELSITPQLQEKITRTAEKSAELTLASLQWERKVTPRTVVRTANWTFPSGTAWWDIQRNSTGACITADSKFSPGTVRIDIANKQQPTWRWSVGGC